MHCVSFFYICLFATAHRLLMWTCVSQASRPTQPLSHRGTMPIRWLCHRQCGVSQLSRGWKVRRKAAPESLVRMLAVQAVVRSLQGPQPRPQYGLLEGILLGQQLLPSARLLRAATPLCRLEAVPVLMWGLQNAWPSSPFLSTTALCGRGTPLSATCCPKLPLFDPLIVFGISSILSGESNLSLEFRLCNRPSPETLHYLGEQNQRVKMQV